MEAGVIRHLRSDWQDAVLVCGKCSKKIGGGFGYWGFRPHWGYSPFGPPLMINQTTRYEAYAEIVVLKPGQEQNENRAVDAREIIRHLAPPPPPPV